MGKEEVVKVGDDPVGGGHVHLRRRESPGPKGVRRQWGVSMDHLESPAHLRFAPLVGRRPDGLARRRPRRACHQWHSPSRPPGALASNQYFAVRTPMPGQPHTPKIRMPRAHGLLDKIPHTHRYALTTVGREIASALLRISDIPVSKIAKLAA